MVEDGENNVNNEIKLFEGKQVCSAWNNEKEEWYFSVVDVVAVLTDSKNPRDYWYRLKSA
ncbi:phage antirepressor protein [Gardnerella sp. KA00390]|uniref:Phage antirepressor protein n=1 Tax=Gardnerella vaginalis TaxID=2702 RepID=A0AAW6Y1V8_GARVA|nr:phage antirepressor protein [Gardnerella vaginalis]MDK7063412.1 phage antirepressor protein [Gardnerella vaginalis]